VNIPEYHFEVVLPVLSAFGNQNNTHIELFATQYGTGRLNIMPLINAQIDPKYLLSSNGKLKIRPPRDLRKLNEYYDLAIFVSCSRDLEYFEGDDFLDPANPKSPRSLICLIHVGGEWADPLATYRHVLSPWIKLSRVQFITLSSHVNNFFIEHAVSEWNMGETVVEIGGIKRNQQYVKSTITNTIGLLPVLVPVFSPGEELYKLEDMEWLDHINGSFVAIPVCFPKESCHVKAYK
jgi:hypothetical protein